MSIGFNYAEIHDMICRRKRAIRWALFRCSVSRISCGGLGLQVLHSKRSANCLVWALHSVSASSHPIWGTLLGNSCDGGHVFSWTPNDLIPVLHQKGLQWVGSDFPSYFLNCPYFAYISWVRFSCSFLFSF